MNHWNSVIYQGKGSIVPAARWGHKILKVEEELLLFGGYGGIPEGQGKYLQDIWKFDLHRSSWIPLKTTGSVPEPRSNYTIHYHSANKQVILFGGGTQSKVRFNTVHILNILTLQWRKIIPQLGQQTPWERTYHTSELYQNFLVVFGGQSVLNLDLDDTWAFDLNTQKWLRLDPQGDCPTRRRFASSALVGSDFYLVGGCQDKYHLIGELHRLSLLPLVENHSKCLKWQCLLASELLSRWGHSINVYENKLYIFSGRVSDDRDNSDLIQYNCMTGTLHKIQTPQNTPEPRRRHATAVVGSSLLVFGGYNGKYYNDFYHIKLSQYNGSLSAGCKVILAKTRQQFLQEIQLSERVISPDQCISVADDCELWQFATQSEKIKSSPYFKACLSYDKIVKLPSFCTLEVFRIVHLALVYDKLYLWQHITLPECLQIAQALEYFCMSGHLKQMEYFLISRVESRNALQMLVASTRCSMEKLGTAAAMKYLQNSGYQSVDKIQILPSSLQQRQAFEVLKGLEKQHRFELLQVKLSKKQIGVFSKTFNAIKMVFHKQQTIKSEESKKASRKRSCMLALWQCLQQMNRLFSFYGAVGI